MSALRKSGSLQGRFVKDVGKLAMRGTLTSFSETPADAKQRVLTLYKACQVAVPIILENYEYNLITVEQARAVVKNMFADKRNVHSLQAIDMLRINGEIELKELVLMYKSFYHLETILSPEKSLQVPETLQLSGQHAKSQFLKSFFKGSS